MIYTVTLNPALDYELTVPQIVHNEVLRATDSRVDFGGKGFNVSRMVAALGGESVAFGFVGGKTGERLQDGLIEAGIRTEFVWLPQETRTNVSIVENGRYIKVNQAGPTVSKAHIEALLNKIRQAAKPKDIWVLAGSLPPGAPADLYAKMTTLLKQKMATVFLDTSGDALRYGCQAGPHWCKPNDVEATAITGETNPIQAGLKMQKLGVRQLVLTLGKDGAYLFTKRGIKRGYAPKIAEANPIGAGDSFVGGMVYGLHAGKTAVEAFQLGLTCGAATASLAGTQVGSREMVDRLLADCVVETAVSLQAANQ